MILSHIYKEKDKMNFGCYPIIYEIGKRHKKVVAFGKWFGVNEKRRKVLGEIPLIAFANFFLA